MKKITLFDSLLIDGIQEVSVLAPLFSNCNWNKVYMLLEKNHESFIQSVENYNGTEIDIEAFKNSVMYFKSVEEVMAYFKQNNDAYLPRQIVSDRDEKLFVELNKIRDERIRNKTDRKNVFISICIPSYNRGNKALEAVQTILNMNYDAEIEIVISNNGSTENKEGYEAIKALQDSRITYYEFDENQGYASNVRKVLGLAKGKWAVLSSDEDTIIAENFDEYLNFLRNNDDTGVVFTQGIGPNFSNADSEVYEDPFDVILMTMNRNYITGITYNVSKLIENRAFERFDTNRGNIYIEYYAHCALALFACEKSIAKMQAVCLWNAHEDVESVKKDYEDIDTLHAYSTLESRLEQLYAKIDFLRNLFSFDKETLGEVILYEVKRVYNLLGVAYWYRTKAFENQYSWFVVCKEVYRNSLTVFENNMDLYEDIKEAAKYVLDSLFFDYMRDEDIVNCMSEEQKEKHKNQVDAIEIRVKLGEKLEDIIK